MIGGNVRENPLRELRDYFSQSKEADKTNKYLSKNKQNTLQEGIVDAVDTLETKEKENYKPQVVAKYEISKFPGEIYR